MHELLFEGAPGEIVFQVVMPNNMGGAIYADARASLGHYLEFVHMTPEVKRGYYADVNWQSTPAASVLLFLLEEAKAAGVKPAGRGKGEPTPACDTMRGIGQWNTAWDPFFELDPVWTDQSPDWWWSWRAAVCWTSAAV
jgi:hypothetical protein